MIRIACTITRIFERRVQKHHSGFGKDATFTTDSAGWYVRLDDQVSIFVGTSRPTFTEGQAISLTLESHNASAN